MTLVIDPCRGVAKLVKALDFDSSMLRIHGDAGHRTNLHALRLVEMADAFGALVRIDLVELGAHVDRIVRALGLADIAVDAFVGDHEGHPPIIAGSAKRAACE